MPYALREDNLAYQRKHGRKLKANRAAIIRELVREIREAPCTDCGMQYPFYVMEFDHRDGDAPRRKGSRRGMSIAAMCRRLSVDAIAEELSKCDLVCANCHKIRTYRRSHIDPPVRPVVQF